MIIVHQKPYSLLAFLVICLYRKHSSWKLQFFTFHVPRWRGHWLTACCVFFFMYCLNIFLAITHISATFHLDLFQRLLWSTCNKQTKWFPLDVFSIKPHVFSAVHHFVQLWGCIISGSFPAADIICQHKPHSYFQYVTYW